MSLSNNPTAIGIDLGTTHCCVAYINKYGMVEVIANNDGYRTTPSYIVLTNDKIVIGKIAKEEVFKQPQNVVYDSKRLIGRTFDDKYLQNDMKTWPFKVKDCNNQPLIELSLDDEPVCYKPQEISAMLLQHMRTIAEDYIKKPVSDAVITVPAHFNYHQRTATAEAGKLAGLNVLGIINEPTAAALAYIHKNDVEGSKNIMVFDFGGGTLDVSIVQVKSNAITVVATAGNTHLGGRDFENNLRNLICKIIEDKYGKGALESKLNNRRISAAVENLKIRLSTLQASIIELPCLYNGEDVEIEVTKKKFEDVNFDLFNAALDIVQHCLADAKLNKSEIDDVVLVGGSTRIPKIQEILSDFFGGKALSRAVNPDEAVAYGAAVQTAKFKNSNKAEVLTEVIDVTPLSFGVLVHGGLMDVIIPRNSTVPVTKTAIYCSLHDKETERCWYIYEGERRLAVDNILLGKCSLKVPPNPPGHAIELTFHVDGNGILQMSARDKSGFHSSLSIAYEQHDRRSINDIINDAKVNKSYDKKRESAINKWRNIRNYCTKLKAICNYDRRAMTAEDKDKIVTTAEDVYKWTEKNLVANASKEELTAIRKKSKELEDICEPIVKKYGYEIKNSTWDKFYELVTDQN